MGVVEFLLRDHQNDNGSSNVHIYSNNMVFDQDGKLVDIIANVIPSKKAELLNEELNIPDNIIVIGDQVGDLQVTHQLKHRNVLSIGFLNTNKIDKK